MRIRVRFAILSAAAACSLAAQPSADLESRISGKIQSALTRTAAPSVSVAIVREGRTAYAQAFGKADVAAGRAATPDTRYAVGSISKQFTAAALLLAQEQGLLSLDDPVSKYFPHLTRAREITIRQLLSHTSGYEDYAPQDYIIPDWTRATTPAAVLDRWANKPLNFDPGTRWQYSNTNFVLAGAIFEKASGKHLLDFLREKIFDPLGMTTAAGCLPIRPGDAVAYTRFALGPPRPAGREAEGWYFAAGELCMTPSDLARWNIAFLDRKILSSRSYEEFTREIKLNNGDSTHYALGLTVGDLGGAQTFQHGGEVSGFIASNIIVPTRRGAVTVLSNQDGIGLVGPLARQLALLVFQPEPSTPPEKDTAQVQAILDALRSGRIDRSLFSDNANAYFSAAALQDIRTSLAPLGKLKAVTPVNENLRGGMKHRSYRAEFARKTLNLNIYLLPNGKYEQFMIEEQL